MGINSAWWQGENTVKESGAGGRNMGRRGKGIPGMKDAVVPEFIGRIKRDMGHQQFGRAETMIIDCRCRSARVIYTPAF